VPPLPPVCAEPPESIVVADETPPIAGLPPVPMLPPIGSNVVFAVKD
jgi:hypothetical protein